MSHKPHFSICIPVYNGEKYLRDCIDSALNQTYENFEIILLDDCSSDNSFSICTEYKNRYSCIRSIRNERNLGLADNLNAVIGLAQAEWIKILLQDDLLDKECLEKIGVLTDRYSFIWHKRSFIMEENANDYFVNFFTSDLVVGFATQNRSRFFSNSELSNLYIKYPHFNFFGEPSNIAFKKDLVKQFGLYDINFKQLLDYEFCLRLTSNTGAYYINHELSRFRVHKTSTSNKNLLSDEFHYGSYEFVSVYDKVLKDFQFKSLREVVKFWGLFKIFFKLCHKVSIKLKELNFLDKIKILYRIYKDSLLKGFSITSLLVYSYTIAPIRKKLYG